MVHLVYCDNSGKKGEKEKEIDKVLSGTKTMVVRRAAGRKIPHSRVFAGERLYFMFMEKGSAEITATAIVKSVQNYVKMSNEEIAKILSGNQNNMDDWLIPEKIADVVAGTSVPYNYEKSKF